MIEISREKFLIVVVLFIAACGAPVTDSKEVTEVEGLPKPLIERFAFEDLDGNKVELAEMKGKRVFINFWATWCKPCIQELPSIEKAYDQLKESDVLFIIASDESIEKIKKFSALKSYHYPLIHSTASVFDLDIQALPTTILIDETGEIILNEIGARDWGTDENIALIKGVKVE
jgi:thiol-disulfide isomerase/thioredoxin